MLHGSQPLRIVNPGDHVKAIGPWFDHHGIYVGNQRVAELAKPGQGGRARLVPWEKFSNGRRVEVVDHPNGLPPAEVLRNVFETRRWPSYRLVDWNCEHFATWCATRNSRSQQIEAVRETIAVGVGIVAFVGVIGAIACALNDLGRA